MKRIFFVTALLLAPPAALHAADAPQPAPPSTAAGHGALANGGRGGRVVHVTTLKKRGPGSFAWALHEVQEPRTIVFDVSGVIDCENEISLAITPENDHVTIAGARRPGHGAGRGHRQCPQGLPRDGTYPGVCLRPRRAVPSHRRPDERGTVKFINENREHPFFLYFPHYAVHTPLQAKPEMIAKYEKIPEGERQGKPEYAAMVESVDESGGRLLATWKDLGREQNTLVIFTSDNGGFCNATSNAPLRANKGAYYEGGIRVPLLIKWPGVTKPGWVGAEPVISNDLYPTCLAAAGVPLRPNQHRDGLNPQPLLAGDASLGRKSLFWHFPHYNEHPSSVPSSVIRRGPWKLTETFDPEGVELYNLADDLSETRHLAAEKPDLVNDLRGELDASRRDVGAEMMRPNPDYDPAAQLPKKGKKKAKPGARE